MKSIYPVKFFMTAPKVMGWLNPNQELKKPEFKVELIPVGECEKEIDYSKSDKMGCVQVGTHLKQ